MKNIPRHIYTYMRLNHISPSYFLAYRDYYFKNLVFHLDFCYNKTRIKHKWHICDKYLGRGQMLRKMPPMRIVICGRKILKTNFKQQIMIKSVTKI